MTCPRCHNAELDESRNCAFCGRTARAWEFAVALPVVDERVLRFAADRADFAEREV